MKIKEKQKFSKTKNQYTQNVIFTILRKDKSFPKGEIKGNNTRTKQSKKHHQHKPVPFPIRVILNAVKNLAECPGNMTS